MVCARTFVFVNFKGWKWYLQEIPKQSDMLPYKTHSYFT